METTPHQLSGHVDPRRLQFTTTNTDWTADHDVASDPNSKIQRISAEDWTRALTYNSDSQEEMLTHPGRIYND